MFNVMHCKEASLSYRFIKIDIDVFDASINFCNKIDVIKWNVIIT